MPSFEILYDANEDVLEVSFAVYEEAFSRTVPLHDQIVLYTDLQLAHGWGLAIYGYAELIEEGTVTLDGLRGFSEEHQAQLLDVIRDLPIRLFVEVKDPKTLLAVVHAPSLDAIIG